MQPARKISVETPPLQVHSTNTIRVYRNKETMLDKIGWKGLVSVVWQATPFPICLISLPYGIIVYRRFLANSQSIKAVRTQHCKKCQSSRLFRWLRPRYHKAQYLLL